LYSGDNLIRFLDIIFSFNFLNNNAVFETIDRALNLWCNPTPQISVCDHYFWILFLPSIFCRDHYFQYFLVPTLFSPPHFIMSFASRLEAFLATGEEPSSPLTSIITDPESTSSCSREALTTMVADNLAIIDPEDFSGFVLGRPVEQLSTGLILLNLSEFHWVRRHDRRHQPPPPVLVWLPGPTPISPMEAALFDIRPLTMRFPA
jgi:hypothetical protein